MKVIHILPHSLPPQLFNLKENVDTNYHTGWHARFAREILNYTKDYELECWRVEKSVREASIQEEEEIIYRIFPTSFNPIPGRESSHALLRQLGEELKRGQVLIHLHNVFSSITYSIACCYRYVPIVASDYFDGSFKQQASEGFKYKSIKAMIGNSLLYLLEYIPERTALKNIDYFFTLNDQCRRDFTKLVGENKVEVQPLGVDFDLFKPMNKMEARKRLNLDANGKYILYVGGLLKLKGLDYLLYSFPKILENFPNSVILLAGDGYYRKALEPICKKLGIEERVKFLGWINNRELPFWYNAADVYVLPAWHHSFTVAGIEALACGTPFIGTNLGGIPDIVRNFRSGTLIPPKNTDAIVEAILQHLSNPSPIEIDRKNGAKHYAWRNIIENTIKIYNNLFERYY